MSSTTSHKDKWSQTVQKLNNTPVKLKLKDSIKIQEVNLWVDIKLDYDMTSPMFSLEYPLRLRKIWKLITLQKKESIKSNENFRKANSIFNAGS